MRSNEQPITPEILIMAGFEKEGIFYTKKLPKKFHAAESHLLFLGDYLYLRQISQRGDYATATLWNKDLMKEFYVHQLQNLWFALTGEELIIKL